MQTFLDSLMCAGDDACVHLEDDIVLTKNFIEKITAQIQLLPSSLIQFFSLRKKDLELGSRWDNNYLMNQCYYCPPGMGTAMLAYAATWIPANKQHPHGTDVLMRDYLRHNKLKYWLHVPSLVQHRNMRSAIGGAGRTSSRQSPTFTDPTEDS